GRLLDILRTSCGRRVDVPVIPASPLRGPLPPLPFSIPGPSLDEASGVLVPVVEDKPPVACLIKKPRMDEGVNELVRVILPQGGLGDLVAVVSRQVPVLRKIEGPPP